MLHGDTIREKNIIVNADDDGYRDAGYDLRVGEIFVPRDDGDQHRVGDIRDSIDIPANGVVVLFSDEIVQLPDDMCAYAMPKTSLCDDGILVFNTGIVDPRYNGRLSGTTVNFRKTPYTIKKGDRFLRLVFEQIAQPPQGASKPRLAPTALPSEIYRDVKVAKARNFAPTFLDLTNTARSISKQVTDEVVTKDRNFLLGIIAIVALMAALPPIISHFAPLMRTDTAAESVDKRVDDLQEELHDALIKIQKLEGSATPPASPAGS